MSTYRSKIGEAPLALRRESQPSEELLAELREGLAATHHYADQHGSFAELARGHHQQRD